MGQLQIRSDSGRDYIGLDRSGVDWITQLRARAGGPQAG